MKPVPTSSAISFEHETKTINFRGWSVDQLVDRLPVACVLTGHHVLPSELMKLVKQYVNQHGIEDQYDAILDRAIRAMEQHFSDSIVVYSWLSSTREDSLDIWAGRYVRWAPA